MRYFLTALLLLVVFTLMAVPAITFMALNLLLGNEVYVRNTLHLMDQWLAACLGWSGKYTISAECGVSDCYFCELVRGITDVFQKDHCLLAARKEGLL